jgi:hypothetical protein
VSDLIQVAATGRSKCRGCGAAIAKGELRFGEALPNAYGEGEAMYWFHLPCAAAMRPEKFLPALDASSEAVDGADELRRVAEEGITHPRLSRLVRAERAPSGRAHCRVCRELIEKGEWRLALQMFEDGRFAPIGSIHLQCAEAYLGTAEIGERLARAKGDLSPADLEEIGKLLEHQRPAPPAEEGVEGAAADTGAEAGSDAAPGLAKTRVALAEEPAARSVKN